MHLRAALSILALSSCAEAPAQHSGVDAGPSLLDAAGGANPVVRADGSVGAPRACNSADVRFNARTPNVYILVDRSSSMFERGLWQPLQKGVLTIVERLQHDVRFGFASYTGQAGGSCPDLSEVALAEGNLAAISSAYTALKPPSYKGETPTSLALDAIANRLAASADSGPKFILLVTDGEPDMCDDGNVTCARDAVLAAAQHAYTRGIGTFIFSIGSSVDRMHLADVANAGAGQAVVDRGDAVKYQCQGGAASYGSSAGSSPFYEPDVANQDALIATFSDAVGRTRSCIFDLSGQVQVDVDYASSGDVRIDGERIAFGAPDGFRMNTSSELELLGKSCARLRAPQQVDVSIDFPCEVLVF